MSQGNDFNYSAAADTGTAGSEEVWFVAVASDDIKQMNVDQLDEAFRLGIITEETAVWTEGMEAWQPLGQVLGEDAGGAPAQREEPAPTLSSSSHANTGSGFGAVTLQSVQHSYAPGSLSVAPVTSSLAPSSFGGYDSRVGDSRVGDSRLGQSGAALSIEDDMPAAHQGRRFRPERWALAAAAVLAAGVAVYNNFSSSVASAGTQAPAPSSLAARPYDGAEKGAALEEKGAEENAAPAKAAKPAEDAPVVSPTQEGGSKGLAAAMATGAAASDATEPPASAKKGSEKDGLKGSFSKAFNGKKEKAAAKSGKVKPRKAASRATTKSRAKAKKPGVPRSQSAFDPLNDSLP
jgi:hypothetical protein